MELHVVAPELQYVLKEHPELRVLAVRIAPYNPAERYVLFEFDVESVVMTEYKDGEAVYKRWKADE